jgi:hypothetical protein
MTILFILVLTIFFLLILIPISVFYHTHKRKQYIAKVVKDKEVYGMKQEWRCALCNAIMLTSCRLTLLENQGVTSPYAICSICANNTICIDEDYISDRTKG